MRRVVIAIGILLVLFATIAIRRRSTQVRPNPTPPPSFKIVDPFADRNVISPFIVEEKKPDPTAAGQALGKALSALSPNNWLFYAYSVEEMHDGAYPEYRRFVREFLEAAGADVVPIVEALLQDCRSPSARYLLASVLGDARKPEGVAVLKRLLDQEPNRQIVHTSLHSIGMANTDEGFEFLREFIRSGKAGDPGDGNSLGAPALAALAQQGVRSLDILLEETRRQTRDRQYPNPKIIGSIRGRDAVDRLRALAASDEDPTVRGGAAMALASTTDATQLESLASLDPAIAGPALLAARNRPDVWEASEATRRKVADRLFAESGAPSGDFQRDSSLLETAFFLSPERSRPLMESLLSKPPRNGDRDFLVRFAAAFADQPDVKERLYQLGRAWNLQDGESELALYQGLTRGALPGRTPTPVVVDRLFDVVGHPDSMEWQRQQAMGALMRSGVSEATLSESLARIWNQPLTSKQRTEILVAIGNGVHSSMPERGALRGTKPDRFLVQVLREQSDPLLLAPAAYVYYSGGRSRRMRQAGGSWILTCASTRRRIFRRRTTNGTS